MISRVIIALLAALIWDISPALSDEPRPVLSSRTASEQQEMVGDLQRQLLEWLRHNTGAAPTSDSGTLLIVDPSREKLVVRSLSTGYTSLEALEKLLKIHPDPCATQAPYASIAFFVAPLSDVLPLEVTSCQGLFEAWRAKQNIIKDFDQVSVTFKRQAEVNTEVRASITRIGAADLKRDVVITAVNNSIGVLIGQASKLAGSITELQAQAANESNSLSQDEQRLTALEGQMQSLLKIQKDSWAKALNILTEINSKVPPK